MSIPSVKCLLTVVTVCGTESLARSRDKDDISTMPELSFCGRCLVQSRSLDPDCKFLVKSQRYSCTLQAAGKSILLILKGEGKL